EQKFEITNATKGDLCVLEIAKCKIMRPRAGFIVKRSSARRIITLFGRGILHSQKRLNDASAGRLRGGEEELCTVNRAAVIGSGEVDDRGITNGGTNDNGDDKNDATSDHLVPFSNIPSAANLQFS